jgi:hypothetical protein
MSLIILPIIAVVLVVIVYAIANRKNYKTK